MDIDSVVFNNSYDSGDTIELIINASFGNSWQKETNKLFMKDERIILQSINAGEFVKSGEDTLYAFYALSAINSLNFGYLTEHLSPRTERIYTRMIVILQLGLGLS